MVVTTKIFRNPEKFEVFDSKDIQLEHFVIFLCFIFILVIQKHCYISFVFKLFCFKNKEKRPDLFYLTLLP